jgi:hypothetical protein
MKYCIVLFFMSLSCLAVKSQDTLNIVENAQKVQLSESELLKAKENTLGFIKSSEDAKRYFDGFIIIGPKLWEVLKTVPEFKKVKEGNVTFKVPKFEKDNTWKVTENIEGKAFQSLDDYSNLWNYLETNFGLSKAAPAALNLTDKYVYWQYFAKLEEGVTAITTNHHRFILQFAKNKIFFLELTGK